MHEIILLTVSGEDKPGVTASLTKILSAYDATILDIGQAVIHELLSLSVLFEVPEDKQSGPLLKDILFAAHEQGLKVKFSPVTEESYAHWVGQQGKERHIITMLGTRIDAEHLSAATRVLASHHLNIDVITRLSGRMPLTKAKRGPYACIEMSVRGTPLDRDGMRAEFLDLAHESGVDIAFQVDDVFRRNRRLVAFDMDSTLIQTEVIDEMAEAKGVGPEVAAITEAAMRGEVDFQESLRQRLALIAGLDEGVLASIAESLPLTAGVERLFRVLRKLGLKTAILSGGFGYFGRYLQRRLGADYVHCNEMEIHEGKLTGNVLGDIVDGAKKAELLQSIAETERIDLRQVIAVGDGANDLPMLRLAGLGIAFRAKPIVKQNARQSLSVVGLDGILYLIGVRDRETIESLEHGRH